MLEATPELLAGIAALDLTLHGVIRQHAQTQPGAPALTFEERSWTYAELEAEFHAAAKALTGAGLKSGDRIAFLAKNEPEFVFLWGGATMLGVVIVPLNWRLAPAELIDILNDAEAKALLIAQPYLALESELVAGVPTLGIVVHGGEAGARGYRHWLAQHADVELPTLLPAWKNEDVAIQLYTSGTTGRAKGVLLTHNSIFFQRAVSDETGISWDSHSPQDVLLVSLTISHVGGLVTFARAFYAGGHAVLLREFEAGAVLGAITRHGVTRVIAVPSTLQLLLRDPRIAETDTSSVKILQYGASPIPLDLLIEGIAVFNCEFVQVYGMTEVGGTIATLPPSDHDVRGNRRMKSIGLPLPGVKIRIANTEDEPVAPGVVGEIQIHAKVVMAGYWKLPAETAKAMTSDGYLRTGDAGYCDEDGYLYLCDRIKDMILTGGENVYPAEVENALFSHPEVVEAAVIGVPDPVWGEAVKAIVVRKQGSDVSMTELTAYLRERIARFKVPKSIDFIAELPRNSAGKVLRRQLREPFWAGMERQIN